MRATIDVWTDLRAELKRIRAGEVWVVTYSIHKDVFGALFAPFRESFDFHILVDCGGICPSGLTDYGPGLTQVCDGTLHAKIVFIQPKRASVPPLAYFLTGNMRQSLVDDENLCVKTELSSTITTALRTWLRSVRTDGASRKPFLLCGNLDAGTQEHVTCKSLGSGILAVVKKAKVSVGKAVLMAPWGCNSTITRLRDGIPSLKTLDIYSGCNADKGDQQTNVWVADVPPLTNCTVSRFVQSQKTSGFIHAKAAMFTGSRRSRSVTYVYVGSGNLTMRGFWDPTTDNNCPNIECGILLTGTNMTARRLASWFTGKVIGKSSRWRRLPAPKKRDARIQQSVEGPEEFMEDVLGLQQNGFERRRLAKLFGKVLMSRRHLALLTTLCVDQRGAVRSRERLEGMMRSSCRRNGECIRRVTISCTEVIERHPHHTRLGVLLDTDTLRDIYVVVNIPASIAYRQNEIEHLLDDLADFGHCRQHDNRGSPQRGDGTERTEEKRLNVRFPYRSLFVLRDNLREGDHGAEEFVRRIKRKVAILDVLGACRPSPSVPMWWKSILIRILKEEH